MARSNIRNQTRASQELAEAVIRSAKAQGAVRVERPGGETGRYVRLTVGGKTVAYVYAHDRAEHELALLQGDPERIARALPDGRDAYTRRFTSVGKAARALRAALAPDAPKRHRRYVAA